MGIIEDIKSGKYPVNRIPKIPDTKGLIWLTMLIEYDLKGNVKILRSFSKPAKESTIKYLQKDKKKVEEKFVVKTESEKEKLF